MSQKLIRDYVFTPGATGVGTIKIPGKYSIEQLVEIVNSTTNTVLFDPKAARYSGTRLVYTAGNDVTSFPTISQREDGFTTITLRINTTSFSATDKLKISVEDGVEAPMITRPFAFGTDAIERMRVSNPQSLIDADFEYGLQPTKWAGYGTTRGYPGLYELPGVDLTISAITTDFTTTSTTNSLITIVFSGAHGLSAGTQGINISGLNRGVTGFSRADGSFLINAVIDSTTINYFARGVVGTSNGQSLFTAQALGKRASLYQNASINTSAVASNGATPSVITITTGSNHGLVPGTLIHAVIGSGTNATLASGPFIVQSVPTATTFTYTARAGGAVTSPASPTVYVISSSTLIHRSFDGGVILCTKNPAYGANVVRQSKKYFRYQSGKGLLWSTGTLFKPNHDIQAISSTGTAIGSTITVVTDAIDHGLQIGATIRLSGVTTSGYDGTYTVVSIVDDYTFTVVAIATLGSATPVLGEDCRVFITEWHGSVVRAGLFDDQNGLFWEHNGSILSVVKRNATFQLTGSCAINLNSNAVAGTNTRFTTQVRVGDKIVIRGMTHYVTNVTSDTAISVTPDYRGVSAAGIRLSVVRDIKVKQSEFNIDKLDGTGPSGFTFDANKMQMVGLQYTWYGAGFVDFMMRGSNGNWVFAHRMKNNNVNNEAYMRSGNLPVRYSIENEGTNSYLTSAIDASQTTIPIADLTYFPTSGTIMIGQELISYTGKSATVGAGNLTGATRAATYTIYSSGSNNSLTGSTAATATTNTGVILISNTCSPTLSHWGSALIMDGGYDNDRGYIFNYQRVSFPLTVTTKTAFYIRLAPSVDNSQVGDLGAKDLLNRSQLLLNAIGVSVSNANAGVGAIVVEGILNPKNFSSATWSSLVAESAGGQPSFAQVATTATLSTGTFAVPGEQVFAFTAPTATSGAVNDRLDLTELKELTGAPLGGNGQYPDGSDILAVNIRVTAGTADGHVLLRWGEAQA
jgi:hypothetical protein